MARVRLNDKSVRRAAPNSGQIELWDDLLPGFGLRIASGGSRTYFVMRRLHGKLVRRTVGKTPPEHFTHDNELPEGLFWPSDARTEARKMLSEMEAGVDPKPVVVTNDDADADTFKAVAERYLTSSLKGGGAKLRTLPELKRKLKVDLKDWQDRPIREIRRRDIQALIDAKAETAPISTNRLLSFVKRIFRWAVSKDIIDADPAASVQKPGEEQVRKRYLNDDEIRLFWRACDKLGEPAGRIFKLFLVSAQRRSEVAGLRRSELGSLTYRVRQDGKEITRSGDAWLLPAARTKRGVDHTVPLSGLAKSLVDDAPRLKIGDKELDCVLASGACGDRPISGWSRYKARLDDLIGKESAKDQGEEYDPKVHQLEPWHLHDLRATAATIMESRLNVPTRVVSRILNHAEADSKSMTARYIRHTWDGEAAEALERWAEELGRIVGLNVIDLSGSRGA